MIKYLRATICFVALFFIGGCNKTLKIHETRKQEKAFVIVIPSYNNQDWYKYNLDSVFSQKYKNYRIIYIDDSSSDNTYKLVSAYVKTHKKEHITTLIRNNKNIGALANHYKAITLCKDHEIIVSLDGDDWFANNKVLQYLNTMYQNPNTWLTYGQFQNWPTKKIGWCKPIPEQVIKNNSFREFGFCMAQPRTYYVWLAKKIKKEDLLDENGNFYKVAGDVALMFPMIEMAGDKFKFISDILCIRNVKNALNDFKVNQTLQKRITRKIRRKSKYYPLSIILSSVQDTQQISLGSAFGPNHFSSVQTLSPAM